SRPQDPRAREPRAARSARPLHAGDGRSSTHSRPSRRCGPSLVGLGVAQFAEQVADRGDLTVTATNDVGDDAGPAGLVRGTEPGGVVAVEVLGEHEVVPPPWVVL